MVRCDFMHGSFLGVYLESCGNCIWELANLGHFCPLDQSMPNRLKFAYWALSAYVRRNRLHIELRSFTLNTFSNPSDTKSPELVCKAHDCRIIVGWLADECIKTTDINTMHGKRRCALAWWQRELCEALEESPRYLIDPYLQRVLAAGHEYLTLYLAFTEEFRDSTPRVWKCLRKLHPLVHLFEDMELDKLNCRFYSGWTDESLMCRVVSMMKGQNPRTASMNVLVSWWPAFVESLRCP